MPVLLSWRTKFKALKGKMLIKSDIHTGMIRIGLLGIGSGTAHYMPTVIENNGKIICNGRLSLGGGGQISVGSSGTLEFGNNTKLMGEFHLIAHRFVRFGSDCMVSWNTQIMDADFHSILQEGIKVNNDKEIIIGNHVWIASHVNIYKGAFVPDHTVIAAGSSIHENPEFSEENTIITGLPNRVLKRNIDWEA